MWGRVVVITIAGVALTGCSALLVDRPPRAVRAGDTSPACTRDFTWPVVDAALATVAVLTGVAVLAGAIEPARTTEGGEREPLPDGEARLVGLAAVGEGLVFAWSGHWGWRSADACRALDGGP